MEGLSCILIKKTKPQKCYDFYKTVRNLNIKWIAHDIKQFLKQFLYVTLVRKYKGQKGLFFRYDTKLSTDRMNALIQCLSFALHKFCECECGYESGRISHELMSVGVNDGFWETSFVC